MEAEDIGADEGSGEAAVFPQSSSYDFKADEADATSGVLFDSLGGDSGASNGTEDLKLECFKADAEDAMSSSYEVKDEEADSTSCVLFEALGGDSGSGNGIGIGIGIGIKDLKLEHFKADAEDAMSAVVLEASKKDEVGFDEIRGDLGNVKMEEEDVPTLEVSVGERGQDACNGNENDGGAAKLMFPGGVVSSMEKEEVSMGALGSHGASPCLGADVSSGESISDPESHESRLFCNKREEHTEREVKTLKEREDEMLRAQKELDRRQNQPLKSEHEQRMKEKEWKLSQIKEDQAMKEIETRTLLQIQAVQKMEVTVSTKVKELAQTEQKLDWKYKQLIKNEDEHRLKEKEWKALQCKQEQELKEKEIELLKSENEQSLKGKNLLQLEKDLITRAKDLATEDTDLKWRQEKLNTTLSELMQIQSNLKQREDELNNREKKLDMNRHKVQTTYYAAKLGRTIGMKNLQTLIGRDEDSDLILPLVAPKVEDCLLACLHLRPTQFRLQTVIFYICGTIWMLACLGGLLGIFSKWPKVQVASTHVGRLLFLAFCIMQVRALWFLVPPSKGSKIAAGILCASVIITHIGCYVQDLIENRES